jgi:hypothetical protein
MPNKQNFNPFQIYSQQLQTLLTQAKSTENPALFLYQNGARNVVFMLEGLTRIHKEAFEHKKLEKWYERFKKIEDLLGKIDFTDTFKKQFEKDKTVDEKNIQKLNKETQSVAKELNKMLEKKGWLDGKMLKFNTFIASLGLEYDKKDTIKILKAYNDEVLGIIKFAHELKFEIREVEIELHEFRRKLRWLSIYPQAFGGLFQFKKTETIPTWSEKYRSEKILNSPFNQLPKAVENLPTIHLDYDCFLALSSIIQDFGDLKDKGLQNFVLTNHLEFTKQESKQILGDNYHDEAIVLKSASDLLKTFFKDGVLENLVV